MKKRFVVIGASAASIAFITKLRSADKDCEIICLSGESDIPYNRCLLADYVSQDISFDQMMLKPKDFFENNNIDIRLNHWVTKIDTANNFVFVKENKIAYDYLFFGIGTQPFIPPVVFDQDAQGLFTFHTADDVKKLSDFVENNKEVKAVVIGAGLNGVECAASLRARDASVTLVERNGQVLPVQADQQVAAYVTDLLKNHQVDLLVGQEVQEIVSKDKQIQFVTLADGKEIKANCVVMATGSVVHQRLIKDTGIATDKGSIVVDQSMKTNIDNVYAGGDVCIVKDAVTGELVKSTTWADAMLQGLCAATQFSSQSRSYPGFVGLRDSQFFGKPFYGCGQTVDHDSCVESVVVQGDKSFKTFYIQDCCLIGFVLIGDISQLAEYKKMYLVGQKVTKNDFL